MPANETVKISYQADVTELRKALAAMPDISSKEARKMVQGYTKQMKAAERAAKKLAKTNSKEMSKVTASLGSAKEAAAGMGGAVGELAGRFEQFARAGTEMSAALGPVGKVMAVVGAATAISALAMGRLAMAIADTMRNAPDLLATMDEMGGLELVSDRAREGIEDGAKAMQAFDAAITQAKVMLAGELGVALTDAVLAVTALARKADGASESFGKWFGHASDVYRVLTAISTLGLSEMIRALREPVMADLAEDGRKFAEEVAKAKEAEEKAAEAAKQNAKWLKESEKVAKELAKQRDIAVDAEMKLTDLSFSAKSDLLTEEEKINQAHYERIALIREHSKAGASNALAVEARAESEERRLRDLGKLKEEQRAADLEGIIAINAAAQAQSEAQQARWEEEKLKRQELQAAVVDSASAMGTAAMDIAQMQMDQQMEGLLGRAEFQKSTVADLKSREADLHQRLRETNSVTAREQIKAQLEVVRADKKAAKDRMANRQEQALKLFRAQKRLAVADALFNASVASLKAIAMFGPPPSPPGVAALIAVAGTLATQMATIQGQKPPTFHTGTSFVGGRGEMPAVLRTGEAVLTPAAADRIGRSAIDNLNHSKGMGGPTTLQAVLQLDGETIKRVVAQLVPASDIPLGVRSIYAR